MKKYIPIALVLVAASILAIRFITPEKTTSIADNTSIDEVLPLKPSLWKTTTDNGFTYKYTPNDPLKARFYTLDNGLTVILAENHNSPRIAYHMAVRSGSNNDPRTHTGLAHYLEHLLFKGTDKFGSLNWEKEKPLIAKIEALYEDYNSTEDDKKRKEIYKEIDKVSGEASKFSIAGEYDNLMSFIGSQGTNAWTWLEETVYTENIPANTVDQFLNVQAERFRNPILRLFHTELETVYEEKNGSLSNDFSKVNEEIMKAVFPTHNYGQQTTLGSVEHLKNPSLKAIKTFYETNYIPNNMAVVMVGDFKSDALIAKIDKAFSYMKFKEKTPYVGPKEAPIKGPIVKTIYTPNPESVSIVFRSPGANTKGAILTELLSLILSNGTAGLLDINLKMEQKVKEPYAGVQLYKDYGAIMISGAPIENQSLEDVKDLLMEQLDLVKRGDFNGSLISAIVANKKLEMANGMKYNEFRITNLTEEFIKSKGEYWPLNIAKLDMMSRISKDELIDFAKTFFKDDNYVVVYKREGVDETLPTIAKPEITPIETNAGRVSAFAENIMASPLESLEPVWVNYANEIKKTTCGIAEVLYVKNNDNGLFELSYNFPFGRFADKRLPIAAKYLNFIGTSKLGAEDISKSFYELACDFNIDVDKKETVITISGLQENFEKAVGLFEELLTTCKADDDSLKGLKEMILTRREDEKLNKESINDGLANYALYGAKNPFNDVLSNTEIQNLKGEDIISILHELRNYNHKITYYGPDTITGVIGKLTALHTLPKEWVKSPENIDFKPKEHLESEVLFTNYESVQADITWLRNLAQYESSKAPLIRLTNTYFGGGMSSIVFSEIRESKALAYSTYSFIATPSEKNRPYQLVSYIGTQADKLNDAIQAMNNLHNKLPESQLKFNNAKSKVKNSIETERIRPSDFIGGFLAMQKLGLNGDIRKANYAKYDEISFGDIKAFHKEHYAHKPVVYCITASKDKINVNALKQYGKLKELKSTEIFGY